MCIFGKKEYKEVHLPFMLDTYWLALEERTESGVFDLEANGYIDGEQKYLFASFVLKKRDMYENGDFEWIVEQLKDSQDKLVTLRLAYKRNKFVGFEMLPESLAREYGDDRFLYLECVGYGWDRISCIEARKKLDEEREM